MECQTEMMGLASYTYSLGSIFWLVFAFSVSWGAYRTGALTRVSIRPALPSMSESQKAQLGVDIKLDKEKIAALERKHSGENQYPITHSPTILAPEGKACLKKGAGFLWAACTGALPRVGYLGGFSNRDRISFRDNPVEAEYGSVTSSSSRLI